MFVVIFKANFKSSPDNNFIGQQLKINGVDVMNEDWGEFKTHIEREDGNEVINRSDVSR